MITEPELTGGSQEPEPDVISDADTGPGRAAGYLRERRHWAWGAGGLVLASALWAAGLTVHDRLHDGRPDLHGYALGNSPCAGRTLQPLTDALRATDAEAVSPAAAHLGPALDQIHCTLSIGAHDPRAGTSRYQAYVTIELHKRTDPRPEFDDQRDLDTDDLTPAETSSPVPGLGDEAYLLTISSQTQELRVLHGGAVFTLTLSGYNDLALAPGVHNSLRGRPPSGEDLSEYRPALVAAMRGVMTAQQPH